MTTNTNDSHVKKNKKKIRSLIYRIILILIASITVGFSFYSWNASRVVGNQLPMPFGFGASVVLSGSMEPTLKVNDLVFVTESDDYQVDDIVVFQNGSDLIIHRIVRIDDDLIITQGDANNVSDDPITADMIKGKYSFRIPFIGFLFRFIKTLPGTLLILALVVYLMYRSRKKERAAGNEELEKIAEEIRLLRMQQLAETSGQTPDGAEQKNSGETPQKPETSSTEPDENASSEKQTLNAAESEPDQSISVTNTADSVQQIEVKKDSETSGEGTQVDSDTSEVSGSSVG